LQLEALREASSIKDARSILVDLPSGLDGTYDRALLSSSDKTTTRRALAWIMAIGDTVTPQLLSEAVRINPKALPVFETSGGLFANKIFTFLPGGLITISDEPAISLSHFSVQEYLGSERIKCGPAADFALNIRDARVLVTESAIAYHFFVTEDPDGSKGRNWNPESFIDDLWFSAGQLGLSTADAMLSFGDRSCSTDIRRILTPSCLAYRRLVESDQAAGIPPTPLILCARMDWYNITAFLLDENADMDEIGEFKISRNFSGAWDLLGHDPASETDRLAFEPHGFVQRGTALLAACYFSRSRIVELLLERGANPYSGYPEIPWALAFAIEYSDVAVVSMLLKDPEVRARCRAIEYSPPHSFCRLSSMGLTRRRTGIVKSLVSSGFSIDELDQHGFTPLYWLARRCSRDISRYPGRRHQVHGGLLSDPMFFYSEVLKENGADMNAKCSEFGSALQCAAARGNHPALEALTRHGARLESDVKAWDAFFQHLVAHRRTEPARFWHGDEGGCLIRLWALEMAFDQWKRPPPEEQNGDDMGKVHFGMSRRVVRYWKQLNSAARRYCSQRRLVDGVAQVMDEEEPIADKEAWDFGAFPEVDPPGLLVLLERVNTIMAGFSILPGYANYVSGMGPPLRIA